MRADRVPDRAAIESWVEAIYARGMRRPGYPADAWTEEFCAERFRQLGLEHVRLEPVQFPYWEPHAWSLRAAGRGGELELACSPLPGSAPTRVEAELVRFSPAEPERVSGKIALCEVPLLVLPPRFLIAARDADEQTRRCFDPHATFEGALQVLPFGAAIQNVMEPAIAAGALGFVGVLSGYPGDSCEYYVPYDGLSRAIPGVWVRGSDGARLAASLEEGNLRARLVIDAERSTRLSHNVVGELPGADDELVVIGSHHDGPWASAVEDASGTALVLAQAAYWASLPRGERPHRLMFLLNAAHMAGGAGCRAFLDAHAGELDRIVLELHLEHAAREFAERGGALVPTGLPEPRWWFTTEIPALERAVREAIEAEGLDRSLIVPPDALGPHPTTDAGFFHLHGVPLVNLLAAPFYLFDASDDLGKLDGPALVPITRAAIRVIESTRGCSAAAMRGS